MVVAALACAHPAEPPLRAQSANATSCRGSDLELDRALASCRVPEKPRPLPPPSALRLEAVPATMELPPGGEGRFTVRITNVTDQPITVDLAPDCDEMEAWISAEGDDTRLDLEEDEGCRIGWSVCHAPDPARVTLEPKGSLRKSVAFTARVKRREKHVRGCELVQARPLPPGRYVVRVALPLFDPVPGHPHTSEPRRINVRLVVNRPYLIPSSSMSNTSVPAGAPGRVGVSP
jgi:hypothetical protein